SGVSDVFNTGGVDNSFASLISSSLDLGATGESGAISITAGSLDLNDGGQIVSSTSGQGNAGSIIVKVNDDVSLSNSSFITSTVNTGAIGDGGNIDIKANSLTLSEGSQIQAGVFGTVDNIPGGEGNAGNVNLDIDDNFIASGFNSEGFSSGVFTIISPGAIGDGGDLDVSADSILLTDSALFNAESLGEGNAGQLTVKANSLSLDNNANINASTTFGQGGIINLQIAEDIILKNNSTISARAFEEANGGNLDIDARFIVAFPNEIEGNGSDIIANAEQGNGGKITISAESLLGIEERDATPNNQINDIDVRSESGLDGTISIFTPDVNPIQRETELPNNIVEPQQTTAQACAASRQTTAQNSLVIKGKGGVPLTPQSPLNSHNISINSEYTTPTSTIPQPLETSQGKIQPARGIKVTEDGGIVLTAYRTNNAGDRLAEGSLNCS
ncbi:MAG: filamentous hemagglutinin, partial [Cyanobacteria bacterium P01_G01_bin.39]